MHSALLLLFGRMFPDYSLSAAAGISSRSSLRWTGSGILERGQFLKLSTSESPSAGGGSSGCSLGDILEPDVPLKYYLSARACAGILRRAGRRGRTLPPHLE